MERKNNMMIISTTNVCSRGNLRWFSIVPFFQPEKFLNSVHALMVRMYHFGYTRVIHVTIEKYSTLNTVCISNLAERESIRYFRKQWKVSHHIQK